MPVSFYAPLNFYSLRKMLFMSSSCYLRATYSILTSTCGGDITSASGELASPLYPDPYPLNSECVWTIVAGPGE